MSQEVEVKIKVDTAKAVTDVNKLGDAFDNTAQDAQDAQKVFSKAGNGVEVEQSIAGLKQLKRELKNTAVGSAEFKKLYNDIDDLEDKLKSAKNTSSDWVDSLEQAGGPIGMLGAGLNRAKVATQSFGGALKATGIGLIVALLGGLVSAFAGNETAMKKIQPLFDGLKKITYGIFRAVEPMVDAFMDLAMKALPYVSDAVSMVYSGMMAYFTFLKEAGGGAIQILKGVFTLDGDAISAGIDKVSGSFGKATNTYKKSMKAFGEGEKELTDSEKEALEKKKELLEKQKEAREKAQADAEAKRQKEIEEQKAFNKEIADLEKSKYEQLRDIQAKSEQEKLDLQAQRDLEEILALQKKGADITKLMEDYNAIYTAKDKELQEKNAQEKEEKDLVTKGKNAEDEKIRNEKILADKKEQADKEMALDEAIKEAKRNALDTGLNILLQFAGKNKSVALGILAVQKGLAIADVVVGASKAIALSTANLAMVPAVLPPGVPNPAYPFALASSVKSKIATKISAGASIASILAAGIGSASSINAGGGGSAGGGGGGGGISTPASAQPSINVVGASKTNAIAETIAQQGQQPIKAYVVANDVTTQQGLDRNIVSSASIG
jgi:hypothetical protein